MTDDKRDYTFLILGHVICTTHPEFTLVLVIIIFGIKMYPFSRPGILKIASLVLLFIVTILGCSAHFNSAIKTQFFDDSSSSRQCSENPSCPSGVMSMERWFVAITIILIIFSVANLVIPFFVNISGKLKLADMGYVIFAGILLLVAACLILSSASKLDRHEFRYLHLNGPIVTRGEAKYFNKIFAGILGLLNSGLYLFTAWVVFQENK